MMKSYRIARLSVITALMLAVSTSAFAIDEWYKALPLLGSLGQIKKDSALTIQDPVFFDPTLKPNQTTYSIRNYLNFKFDEASGVLLPDSFTVTVYVKLYLTVLTSNGGTFMDSSTFTNYPLTLRYFKGGRSWNMADMNFQSAVRVKAVVQSVVTSAGATYTAIAGALMLESEMKVSREYNFNCTTNVISTVSTDASMMSSKGELRVSWPKDRMANEYDLEWAYIDSSALSYYTSSGNIDPKKIFVNNATRVSISKEEYYIPLLYDNPGILFYRVRPVQIKYSGQRVEATWSSEVASSGLGQYSYASGHEPYLNWQATTSFAEEGKRKSVVQYYDGSLRSRQTVTKDNTTDTTIVAETMYDYQGRPVIQVMPSPSLSTMIKYTPNFNTDINNAEYDKAKYDDVLSGANGCGTGAAAMSSQAGASNYYSPNNPNKNNRYNKYIPDAKNYPFAETQYMADNTGRISKQGGVGFDMQIGRTDTVYNDSHETRYFYGSADQEDLDALFGTDAGNASHYFKNMVRDANGQYSVSYVDMHGRTIATALAGKPKAYLDSVKSSRVTSITKRLIDSVNNIKKGTLIESSKSLIVTFPAIDTFKYRLNADSIRLSTCTGGQICYDCLYDLTITITDDCGNQFNNGTPFTYTKSNFTIGNLDTTCNKPNGFVDSFALFLPVASYLVTKRLSVSKYGMDYYRDSVFMVKNTCKTLDDFIAQQRSLVYSQLSCAPTCQRCSIDTFRTWNLFRPYYLNQIGIPVTDTASYTAIALAAYNRQLKECDELCGNTTVAAGIRRQMLADITPPYGQYANPNAIDENSIFYPSTLIPGRPRFADIQTYFDQNGNPDQITTATGTDIPQNASVSDFTDNFKDSWADSLITKHPEYCKLKTYESSPAFSGSNLFDQQFAAITTYKQAKAAGYLNPLGYADVVAQPSTVVKDPFFDGSINPTYAATWRSVLNDSMRLRVKYSGSTYLDIWSLATAMAQCDSGSNSCYAHYSGNQFPFDIDTSCAGSLDMAWRFFREMYLAKKREIINKILGQACNAQININTATHTLNFPDQVTAMQKVPVSTTNITDSINNLVSSSCRSYVAQWWNELAPCNYTSADTAYLFPRLIKICTEGGDMNHPFGSSTTKPSSTYHYHSFAELIQAYNDSLHAAGDPRNLTPGQCNAYLLSAPAPYDNRPASSNQELWTKPDSCQCTTINTLYRQYQSAGASDASFAAYLLRVAGTTISNSTLDSLRGLCNGTLTCRYLASPIIVPPVLQCGVKDVCADCSMVGNAYTKFQTAFPGVTPTYASTDSIQRANNILFERFMNASLGFSKQAVDYLTFMDSCGGTSAATKCDTLSNILNGFRNRYLSYGNPDTSHFIFFPISTDVPILTNRYSEIFTNGYAHVTHAMMSGNPYENAGLAIKKFDTLCVNNAFTIEGRVKGDSIDMLGGRLCHGLNLVFWDQNGNAFSPTFQMPGTSGVCGAGTWNITQGNNVGVWDTTNKAMYYRNQLEWYRIKMVVRNFQVKVYANDTLITTVPYTMPINKLTKWALGIGCGYVDYVKVWDSTGVLQYSEEFEDCRQSASNYPPAFTCASDCQTSFTSYFNQQKGTNYSYTQIDSLYNTCNVKLTPCSDTLASKLSYLKNEFINNYYNHGRKYDANGCDTMTWKVDYGPIFNQTGVPHNRVFHDGVMQFPDTLNKAPVPYHVDYDFDLRDSACVENHFSIEFKMKDSIVPASSFQKLITTIALDSRPGLTKKYYIVFNAKFPNNSYIAYYDYAGPNPSYSREIFNVSEFGQVFGGWKVVKFELIDSLFKFYVDGNLLRTFTFPVNVMPQKMYGMGFSSQGENKISAAFDWIKMYDKNGQLFYNEDFNDCSNNTLFDPYIECPKPNCSNAFTSYYNQQQSTNYTYNQIDSIYRRYGLVTGVCQSNSLTLCGRSAPVFPPVTLKPYSPCDDSTNFIMAAATIRYQAWADSVKGAFNDAYLAKCLNAYKNESFTVTQPMSEFHYTLYYYDQAGNLLRTVPPEGVDMSVFGRTTYFDSVRIAKANGTSKTPNHTLRTDYRYNTLNQVVVQSTPDAGQSKFWYDRLGRLVFSQNLKQKNASTTENNRQYSYTTYDYLGRINEVGQLNNSTANGAMGDNISRNDSLRNVWLLALTNRKEQVTRTYYDLAYPYTNTIPLTARNLRNRVAYTTITSDYSTTNFNAATFYSYDIHGNVDTLLQDYGASTSELTKNIMNRNGNRWARMVYQYDLISGKVNHVAFNPPYFDVTTQAYVMPKTSFYHRYSYDAENRLTMVETSRDSVFWQKDARYEYYKHGPLARVVIGDQQVQGLDYAYTIQGWLKGVNSTAATSTQDMGGDGLIAGQNVNVARDVFGFSLNYFGGDYSPINSVVNPFPNTSGPLTTKAAYRPLYNGNISSMAVNIKPFNQPYLYNYKYDQLNRLTAMDAFTGLDTAANNWTAITATKAYNERVSYDGNGNIKTYNRYFDVTSTPMDSLSYNYIANSNKLSSVTDKSQGWVNANYKLKNQAANNYAYDDIGNLIKDSSEYIPTGGIKWNVYGKIAEINHSQAGVTFSTRRINYFYDAAGNRIGKKVVKFGSANVAWTWYVRDAQGNVMGVYTAAKDTVATDTTLSPFQLLIAEHHIYGSSRLGVSNLSGQDAEANLSTAPGNLTITRGERFYELSNHLGNVLAVISDKKMGHTSNSSSLDYYNPDIVSVTDYYPFGMVSRSAYLNNLNLNYRYSFNGKENDKDVKGDGNQQDYGMRIYDPRLGRFLSVDPIAKKYPELSPYPFASDRPIQGVDQDGLEFLEARIAYEIFVGPFIRMREGANKYVAGDVQASAAQTGNASYQNDQVPKDVQKRLEQRDVVEGAGKMIEGGTEMHQAISDAVLTYTPIGAEAALTEKATGKLTSAGARFTLKPSTVVESSRPPSYLNWGEEFIDVGTRSVEQPLNSGIKSVNFAEDFISSATKESKNGLSEVGRALQKHAGREGSSFSNIKFSGKTGNQQGLEVLNDILTSKNQLIQKAENGTTTIFDKTSGRGVNVSRNGSFNGFRDIKEIKQ